MPTDVPAKIRCRAIADGDLDGVIALLVEGFPGRDADYWRVGLERLARRAVPEGCPRYGYLLEVDGQPSGVLLLIATVRDGSTTYANAAGWYVKPAFRSYAQPLVSVALRNKGITYLNISPAPHTWPIVESQGYTRYCSGLFFALAAIAPAMAGASVEPVLARGNAPDIEALPEFTMLREHAEYGCSVVVCRDGGALYPFIFRPLRIRSGKLWTPVVMTLFCRDRNDLVRYSGTLGRYLLRRGAPVIAMDADGPVEGLKGIYTARRGRKYFKGPHRPRQCDLTNTEFAIFGL